MTSIYNKRNNNNKQSEVNSNTKESHIKQISILKANDELKDYLDEKSNHFYIDNEENSKSIQSLMKLGVLFKNLPEKALKLNKYFFIF